MDSPLDFLKAYFGPNPESWVKIAVGKDEPPFEDEKTRKYKDALHKHGIETKELPLEFSANIIYIKRKDLARASKALKSFE